MRLDKRRRLQQILLWLDREHPSPYRVQLAFTPDSADEHDGWTVKEGRQLIITLKGARPLWVLEEVLIHEYAHCLHWQEVRAERGKHQHNHHDGVWGVYYARLYAAYYDLGGQDSSHNVELPKEDPSGTQQ